MEPESRGVRNFDREGTLKYPGRYLNKGDLFHLLAAFGTLKCTKHVVVLNSPNIY